MPGDHKTEPPTAARLRRARREGDHPVSAALIAVGALAAFSIFAAFAFEALLAAAAQLLGVALAGDARSGADGLALRVAELVAPVLGVAAIGALVMGLWQTGGAVSLQPLAWSWQRLKPWANARRSLATHVFSALSLLLLVSLLGACAWHLLRASGAALAASVGNPSATADLAMALCRDMLLWALGITLLVAIGDAVVTRHAWYTRLRMTRDEVRREQRESEGDVGLKQARRRIHQELVKNAEAIQLEAAVLLVLGPPRLAIALRYDPRRDRAPRVVIRATGALAKTLEALAPSYGIPVQHDPGLARMLAGLPVDEDIPQTHYAAVRAALQLANPGLAARSPS